MDLFFDSFNSKRNRSIVRKAMGRRYGAFGGGPGTLLIGGDLAGTVAAPQVIGSHFKGTPVFDVKAYGAVGDGVADDTAAINSAITAVLAAAATSGATLYFPKGVYLVTSALTTISAHRVNVLGAGPQASVIKFNPGAAATCFKFKLAAATILVQCSLKMLGFTSSDATFKKTALNIVDVDIFTLEDFAVNSWTGATSVGLLVNGRDMLSFSRLQITADLPVNIGVNPNNSISIDHAHWEDIYLIGSGNPCIVIDTGVNLTQVSFDGAQAWVGGTYGLYWLDTTSTLVSQGLSIKNLRTEGGSDATAYSIYISHNTNLQDCTLENTLLDSGRKGVYLRKVNRNTWQDVVYPSVTREGINVSFTSNDSLQMTNCFFQAGSTVSMTGAIQRFALAKVATGSPIPDTCFWTFDYGVGAQSPMKIWGSNVYAWSGDIANGGVQGIPPSNNGGRTAAMIFAFATDSSGVRREGGMAIHDSNGLVIASGTANFVSGNVGGKFCLLHGGGTSIINNLGATCHVICFAIYY